MLLLSWAGAKLRQIFDIPGQQSLEGCHGIRSRQILEHVVQVGIRFKAVGTSGAHEGEQIRPRTGAEQVVRADSTRNQASANLYSIAACARVNGLEPYAYFRHLFEELPKASTAEALEVLLPWNAKSALRVQGADVGAACRV